MAVTLGKEGSVTLLKFFGPMITDELHELDRELKILVENWIRRIVLDMTEVQFIDSAGLELLSAYRRKLADHGLKLKLCGLNEMTRSIFEYTRLSRQWQIFPDTATAVRSFL